VSDAPCLRTRWASGSYCAAARRTPRFPLALRRHRIDRWLAFWPWRADPTPDRKKGVHGPFMRALSSRRGRSSNLTAARRAVTSPESGNSPSGRRCYQHPRPSGGGVTARGGQGAFYPVSTDALSALSLEPSTDSPASDKGAAHSRRRHNILWIRWITSPSAAATKAVRLQPPARRADPPARRMRRSPSRSAPARAARSAVSHSAPVSAAATALQVPDLPVGDLFALGWPTAKRPSTTVL
jgi:hypothetical protein